MTNINDAIRSLIPASSWMLCGNPKNEIEFNSMFNIVTGVDDSNSAIYSNDQSNFGITWNQVQDEIARLTLLEPFNACKAKAKQLIAASDWSALPDVGLVNQADFLAYRAALRALIINPVADPVWPTEPTPEWG
jgi:hypothetical protein